MRRFPSLADQQAAIDRWGLDAAPPDGRSSTAIPAAPTAGVTPLIRVNPELKPEARRRVRALVTHMGSPLDVVRGMMAKPVPHEWALALREISPVSETASHLLFAWKGPPLEPDKQRWCLYEAIPDPLIQTERRMELAGAPFWALPKAERAAQATIVSAYQWEMYRRYKLDVRPFWCLQGSAGGTPLHHTRMEQRYLRMMRKPEDPAPVGALRYAPWDGRVKRQVLARDRLVALGGTVAGLKASGTPVAIRAETEQQEREYRRAFWDWFGETLAPATELYAYILKHEAPDRQRQDYADATAAAEARELFIETGTVGDPVMYKKRILVSSL